MNIVCVKCGAAVAYSVPALADQAVIACPTCQSGLRVTIQAFALPAAATAPTPSMMPPRDRDRVVVAVNGEATREVIGELLSAAGFEVIEAANGGEALAKIGAMRPEFILVDVGLSDVMGFQVCEAVRRDPANAGVKVILVAAIHNKDRYRRQPDSLFGADDYIERHLIEAELIKKVNALRGAPAPALSEAGSGPSAGNERIAAQPAGPAAAYQAPAERPPATPQPSAPAPAMAAPVPPAASPKPAPAMAVPAPPPVSSTPTPSAAVPVPPPVSPTSGQTAAVNDVPAAASSPSTAKTDNPAQEAARRLARIIVSDIALYNAKKVDEGVVNGTFFDLLRGEIEEGRKLYEERKGSELQSAVDLFQQTLEQFVATRRELLKRNRPAA
jgi:CheY-like chemotaxis protein